MQFCGKIALRSVSAAIFGTSAGNKSHKRGDKSRQPNTSQRIPYLFFRPRSPLCLDRWFVLIRVVWHRLVPH